MNGSRNIKIIVAVIAAAVLCCGAIWYIHSRQSKTYSVPLVINAEGLDTKQGTKIPIRVKGKDIRGNAVNKSFYGGTSSSDIALKPGKYRFTVSHSPIAKDGTIYNVDGASTDTSISKDGKVSVKSEITIPPIAAEKVTDEEIKKACDAAKDSGISTSKLNTLKKKAQTRRDDAVAEKTAASSSGHAYSNDYFYIDVPDDWTSSDWSVEQINSVKWKLEYKPNNHPVGEAVIVVAADNPWPKNNGAVKDLGKLANGQNVYVTFAGGGFSEVSFGLNSTWSNNHEYAQENGLTDEGETDWNAIWKARDMMRKEQTGK